MMKILKDVNNVIYIIFLLGILFHLIRSMFYRRMLRGMVEEIIMELVRNRKR